MDYIIILGLIAGTLTTIANLPQFLKSWKSKSTHDLSLPWVVISAVGVFMWLIYGIFLNSIPLILANIFTLALLIGILYLKLKYG
ncbi:MAG TPA: SemiSWEET transporter [archaeon]|nr:SemiSWEET transporter [archaeon]